MLTSNYWKAKPILQRGISVANGTPPFFKGPTYYPICTPLDLVKMEYEPFKPIYIERVLSKLDPQKVWDDLHKLVKGEPVLLCWERSREKCHRRILAEWFWENLGEEVLEYPNEQAKIF